MIDKDEIDYNAQEFEIKTSDVQRDYIFGWVLAGIYGDSKLKDLLILKGGNCLRKGYFENTRFSSDLDFSTTSSIDYGFFMEEMNKVCNFIEARTGVVFDRERNSVQDKKRVDSSKKVLEAKLFFKDFYGRVGQVVISVKLDVTQFDKIYLEPQKRFIIHPYSDFKDCRVEIRCQKLEEVLASKLKCLLQRRHSSDFYDYAFSLLMSHDVEIDKAEIVQTFLKTTIFDESPGAARALLIDLPFKTLKDLWERFIIFPKQGFIEFDAAIEAFKNNVATLFEGMSTGNIHNYFPPEYRNLILEAGSQNKMLKLSYSGITRLVEPYSLSYKTRKDGVSKEYLYTYDTTRNDIRQFVQEKIEDLEISETKFEPRFEVELLKAGNHPENKYFADPIRKPSTKGKKKRPSLKFLPSKQSNQIFTFQCQSCGRKFKKKNHDSRMNPHMDKNKNSCRGLFGSFVKSEFISPFSKPKAQKKSGYELKYRFKCPVCNKLFTRKKYDARLNKHKDKYGNNCFGRIGVYLGN